MKIGIENFVFVDPAKLSTAPDGIVECLRDRWWPVDAQGRIAFGTFLRAAENSPIPGLPICSRDVEAAWGLLDEGFAAHEWGDRVVFFPVIFRERARSDFGHCG